MNKYNGMKYARDWKGKRIISTEGMKNYYLSIPAGSKGVVLHQSPKGLTIEFDPCKCCGVRAHISKVGYFSIALDVNAETVTP